jgi:hypothetical protein
LLRFLSQSQVIITAVDADSMRPIQSATCSFGSVLLARSNEAGAFVLEKKWIGKNIKVAAIGYRDTTFVLSEKNTLVVLNTLSYNLPEISIGPNDQPKLEWASSRFHIHDFAFVDSVLIVLVFEKEKRWKSQEFEGKTLLQGCALIALDRNRNPLDTVRIADGVWWMNKEWFGHLLLDGPFCLEVTYNNGIAIKELSRSDYDNYWANIRLSSDQFIYTEEGSDLYPERTFRWTHAPTNSSKVLCSVRDAFSLELMRSEWKYLAPHDKVTALKYESDLGVDKEVISAFMTGFQNTHYYEPVHAQLLPYQEDLLLLDRSNLALSVYSKLGSLKHKVCFFDMAEKGWQIDDFFLFDDKCQRVYAVSHRHGVTKLYSLNLETGVFSSAKTLTYRNVETMQVKDNKVFYIYRVFESDEKLRLYSEPIMN